MTEATYANERERGGVYGNEIVIRFNRGVRSGGCDIRRRGFERVAYAMDVMIGDWIERKVDG